MSSDKIKNKAIDCFCKENPSYMKLYWRFHTVQRMKFFIQDVLEKIMENLTENFILCAVSLQSFFSKYIQILR